MTAVLCALGLLSGCGGGSSGGASIEAGSNVASIFVDGGPAAAINGLNSAYVSVTVCEPGSTSNCTLVDHVLLDTGSTGLRLLAPVINALALPQEMTAASQPLFECLDFADSYAWGSVRLADVQIADGKAASLPVQLLGESAIPAAPSECSRALTSTALPAADSVAALNANGILGIGVFREDCGAGCTSAPLPGDIYQYYVCAATCTGATLAPALQLQNPVYHFAGSNNNGVVIELPAVGPAGSFGARGSLILGIGTQSNNALGSAAVLPVDGVTGFLTTIYNGQTLTHSFIDSASKGLYFDDVTPLCAAASVASGLYCPGAAAPLALSATVQGLDGTSVQVDFSVGDGLSLLQTQPTYNAFSNFAGPLGDATSFDWGLPFFYGRRVYVAIEGQSTAGGAGPYFAF